MDACDADRLPLVVQEDLVRTILGTLLEVLSQQLRRGCGKIDHPFLSALAVHPQEWHVLIGEPDIGRAVIGTIPQLCKPACSIRVNIALSRKWAADGFEQLLNHTVGEIARQTTLRSKVVAPRDDRVVDIPFLDVGQVIVEHPDRDQAPLNGGHRSPQLTLPVDELVNVVHGDRSG